MRIFQNEEVVRTKRTRAFALIIIIIIGRMGTRKGRSNLEKYLLNTRDPFLIRISRLGGGRGRIRIVDVIADGGSEEKGIYCRNFRKFFRGIAALFPGTKKRRLHAAGGTS